MSAHIALVNHIKLTMSQEKSTCFEQKEIKLGTRWGKNMDMESDNWSKSHNYMYVTSPAFAFRMNKNGLLGTRRW